MREIRLSGSRWRGLETDPTAVATSTACGKCGGGGSGHRASPRPYPIFPKTRDSQCNQ